MKRQYITPAIQDIDLETEALVCACSIKGVEGTESLRTTVSNEETSEYLSRRRRNVWETEEGD